MNFAVRNALELKRVLMSIPDDELETYVVCVANTDVEEEDTVELEFSKSCKALTIYGERL